MSGIGHVLWDLFVVVIGVCVCVCVCMSVVRVGVRACVLARVRSCVRVFLLKCFDWNSSKKYTWKYIHFCSKCIAIMLPQMRCKRVT